MIIFCLLRGDKRDIFFVNYLPLEDWAGERGGRAREREPPPMGHHGSVVLPLNIVLICSGE